MRAVRIVGMIILSIVAAVALILVAGVLWIKLQAALGNNPFR